MRPRSVAVLSKEKLKAMPTRALLARLQRLRECEESADRSDLDSGEIAGATGIIFKVDPLWSEARDQVKAILKTREHVPRAAALRAKKIVRTGEPTDGLRPGSRR
jgi:hypothetical protein